MEEEKWTTGETGTAVEVGGQGYNNRVLWLPRLSLTALLCAARDNHQEGTLPQNHEDPPVAC